MKWVNYIDDIVCLNLAHREDRLIQFTKQAEELSIPFRRYEAIHNPSQGAKGLMDTMIRLFNEEVEKGTQNLLVFEDDAKILCTPDVFHENMDKVVDQLPDGYHLCFLGCQITANGCRWHSPNLIQVIKSFSTHSVIWSLQGMREVLSRGFGFPIDNWLVDNIEPIGRSYCAYPILFGQQPGHSDIGGNFVDWSPFLEQRFNQKVHEIRR